MKTVVVCIAKDEDHYIEEWVNYYEKLGFDEIFMYENDWVCPIDRPFLRKKKISGAHMQMPAYNDFLNNYRDEYDWIAFFDVDEYLVLKKHKNIKDFLTEHDNEYGIGVNWLFFGGCGRRERGEYPNSLLKQFTVRQDPVDQHIKTILKSKSGGRMVLPHNPNTYLMDTNGNKFGGPYNPNGPIDQVQLNHYHHKTYEDWLVRCKRGQADHTPTKTPEQWENTNHDFCNVDDFTARDFMYG
jgi:hypothetical protein